MLSESWMPITRQDTLFVRRYWEITRNSQEKQRIFSFNVKAKKEKIVFLIVPCFGTIKTQRSYCFIRCLTPATFSKTIKTFQWKYSTSPVKVWFHICDTLSRPTIYAISGIEGACKLFKRPAELTTVTSSGLIVHARIRPLIKGGHQIDALFWPLKYNCLISRIALTYLIMLLTNYKRERSSEKAHDSHSWVI